MSEQLIKQIIDKLCFFENNIKHYTKNGYNDIAMSAEDLYCQLFNRIFGYQLKNANNSKFNNAGFDLIDEKNRIIIQVSTKIIKKKIEDSFNKTDKKYSGYNFKFIQIIDEVHPTTGIDSHGFNFDFKKDVFDNIKIESLIKNLDNSMLEEIDEIIESVISKNIDILKPKMTLILSELIMCLAEQKISISSSKNQKSTFEIEEKIKYNNLENLQHKLLSIANISTEIEKAYDNLRGTHQNAIDIAFSHVKTIYIQNKDKNLTKEDLFFEIARVVKKKILSSNNYQNTYDDELDYTIELLLGDMFMKCEIFEKPKERL